MPPKTGATKQRSRTRTGAAARGRPGKLTHDVIEILGSSLERGDSLEGAAAAAGISRSTLTKWMRRGAKAQEEGESCPIEPATREDKQAMEREALYAELFGRVRLALARAEADNLRVIEEAGRGGSRITETVQVVDGEGNVVKQTTTTKQAPAQWKAAAWRLERLYPGKYGSKDRRGAGSGGSLIVEIVEDTPEAAPQNTQQGNSAGGDADGGQ